MSARVRILLIVLLALGLGACGKALRWTPESHTVRSGETLYSIAVQYDLDYRQLARWNRLGDGGYIRKGQKLRLRPPTGGAPSAAVRKPAPSVPAPTWGWPTRGRVAMAYGAGPKTQSGIRIAGTQGQPVVAVASGEVVYAGDGLPTYGLLVIIKHNATWLSAYGYNAKLQVKEGDRVKAGQTIAGMGADRTGNPQLHFEIRRNGQPVDPIRLLPRR